MSTRQRELRELLEQLRAELVLGANPDRQARALLRPNRHGWTAEPYHPRAFKLWEALARQDNAGHRPMHHLAIMLHARAFDLEVSGRPAEADPDWAGALELWHRLWRTDSFWEELAGTANPEAVDAAREHLPERLLQIHFDIALDEETPAERGRRHVRFALRSSFGEQVKQRVRLRAYERAVSGLDPATWHPHTFDEPLLRRAVDVVHGHLAIDEACQDALTDLLSLLVRLAQWHVAKANAAGRASGDFDAAIRDLRELARRYGPAVGTLSTSDIAAQEQLISWHDMAGQAASILGEYDFSIDSYRKALALAAATGDPAEDRTRARLWRALAEGAIENAGSAASRPRATRWLRELDGEPELPPYIDALRAQALYLLDSLDEARLAVERSRRTAARGWPDPLPWREDQAETDRMCADLLGLINERRSFLHVYGGAEAFRLQQQAVGEYNGGNHRRAAVLLIQALGVCLPSGHAKLGEELAMSLTAWFNKAAKSAMPGQACQAIGRVWPDIKSRLGEGIALVPGNQALTRFSNETRQVVRACGLEK